MIIMPSGRYYRVFDTKTFRVFGRYRTRNEAQRFINEVTQ